MRGRSASVPRAAAGGACARAAAALAEAQACCVLCVQGMFRQYLRKISEFIKCNIKFDYIIKKA